jgi:hypothetical protein
MSVQKKSLIGRRSAVKSAILATPQTSNFVPALSPAVAPKVSHKVAPKVSHKVAPKVSHKVAPKVSHKVAPKAACSGR